ncbi:phage minor capsid protein [Enterococcus sp. AZ103]|uniref:phage minor capsid protein n=1 Tax=Enterococcus sp. AZ103 TaxID=2774628 RepID=UPI003F1F61C2
MAYDVGRAFERIEQELIDSMMRNMKRHRLEEIDSDLQWSQWQAAQLQELQKFKQRNSMKYNKQFKEINQNIRNAIIKAKATGEMTEEVAILEALQKGFVTPKRPKGMSGSFFRINERKMNTLLNAVEKDMKKAEQAVLRFTNDQYRQIIFDAQVYANSGAATYNKAVDMATNDFLKRGINCIQYKNGAQVNIASYAEMAIRTAAKRAYLQGEGQKREEWGIHTVIMNKRFNACPLCLPFEGKVLIDDVWSGGSTKDGPYPLMSSAMSAGLYHPNCKDIHTTYFHGISTPPDDRFSKKSRAGVKKRQKLENLVSYADRQKEKQERLNQHSLDEENQQKAFQKRIAWEQRSNEAKDKLKVLEEKTKLNLHENKFNQLLEDIEIDILEKESYEHLKPDRFENFIKKYGKISNKNRGILWDSDSGYIQTTNSFKLNRKLRGLNGMEPGPDSEKTITVLDELIEANRLEENILVDRWVKEDWLQSVASENKVTTNSEFLNQANKGALTYSDKGFVSTSLISEKNVMNKRNIRLQIQVPAGSNAFVTDNIFESEMILNRDSHFQIIKVDVQEVNGRNITNVLVKLLKGE